MGVTKKPSGVNIIGLGAEDLNEFKPVDQLKDLYIQLTADGATDESMDYLAYLKSYAEHNQSIGLPIMPNGVNVWISNNGKTSAVEADDLSLEDGVYTICGIKCEDGEWDFTNAGQHSGGGGGSSELPEVDSTDNGKVLTVIDGAWAAGSGGGGGGSVIIFYPTNSLPTTDDLPEVPVGFEWELDSENNAYISREKNGTALTYTELSEVLEEYLNGATVLFMNDTEQTSGEYTLKTEFSSRVIDTSNMTVTDANDEVSGVSLMLTTYNDSDLFCRFDARAKSTT